MSQNPLNAKALKAAIEAARNAEENCDPAIEAAIRAYLASQEAAAPSEEHSLLSAKFRKKPVVIEAIQWTGQNLFDIISFTDGTPDLRGSHAGMRWEDYSDLVARDGLKIFTLEGKMSASPGDWIIRGVKGELYPCRDDIFKTTYEPVASPAAAPSEEPVAKPIGCIDRHEQSFASAKTHNIESLIAKGWTAVFASPAVAPVASVKGLEWIDCTGADEEGEPILERLDFRAQTGIGNYYISFDHFTDRAAPIQLSTPTTHRTGFATVDQAKAAAQAHFEAAILSATALSSIIPATKGGEA